jgi:hypothetical protein
MEGLNELKDGLGDAGREGMKYVWILCIPVYLL